MVVLSLLSAAGVVTIHSAWEEIALGQADARGVADRRLTRSERELCGLVLDLIAMNTIHTEILLPMRRAIVFVRDGTNISPE